MSLIEIFKEYREIAEELHRKVRLYCHCFALLKNQDLKESVLQEKVSEEEKKKALQECVSLETDIRSLFTRFLNHMHIIERAIQREKIVDFNIINDLNEEHITAMQEYVAVVARFESLKKRFPDYIFEGVINFSEMERQKQKLNDVVLKFNLRFSAITEVCPLYEVDDCILYGIEQENELYRKIFGKKQ